LVDEKLELLRRLPRAQRREQILAGATEAFACNRVAATSLDGIAAQAGMTRALPTTARPEGPAS